MKNQVIMFICPLHDGRSQMAAAIANALYVPSVVAESAALTPRAPHPLAVQVMREVGIDIGSHPPRTIARTMLRHPRFDTVIALDREAHEFPLPGNLKFGERWLWECPEIAPDDMDGAELLGHLRNLRDAILGQILHWGDSIGIPPRDDVSGMLLERAMHMAALEDE
jgi:arsenate reductase (thioredoxin)